MFNYCYYSVAGLQYINICIHAVLQCQRNDQNEHKKEGNVKEIQGSVENFLVF